MADTVAEILHRAGQARREGRLADARRDAGAAVELGREEGTAGERIAALKVAGQIERGLGEPEVALTFYEEAATLGRGLGDLAALAHTLRHIADLHYDAGRVETARPLYQEALGLYRQAHPAPLDLANALRPLARLEQESGHRAEADRFWREARELYRAVGVEAGVAECEAALAELAGTAE